MGWTFTHATHYKPNGQIDRKTECDHIFNWKDNNVTYSVLKSQMIGSTHYAAIKRESPGEPTTVFATITLTKTTQKGNNSYYNFGYKSMTESMNPSKTDCPKSILNILTARTNTDANKWRQSCWEKYLKPKLRELPIGTHIQYTRADGNITTLIKMAPAYQFKKDWWYNTKTNTYISKKDIPNNWNIVSPS